MEKMESSSWHGPRTSPQQRRGRSQEAVGVAVDILRPTDGDEASGSTGADERQMELSAVAGSGHLVAAVATSVGG